MGNNRTTHIKTLARTTNPPRAECTRCDFTLDPSPGTVDNVKVHVRSTGHSVRIVREDYQLIGLGNP